MALRYALLDARLHDRAGFRSGEPSLDRYLKEQAGQHQRDGIATTHVIVEDASPVEILGYCSLAAAQVSLADMLPEDRQRLPRYPVSAVRVARLAVSMAAQGRGLGRLLLGHAVNSALVVRTQLGVRVLIVDALDDRAAAFYRGYGFRPTAIGSLSLYLALGRP
jgi:ribosomal protein S18 acetylase RimI-like enzyme